MTKTVPDSFAQHVSNGKILVQEKTRSPKIQFCRLTHTAVDHKINRNYKTAKSVSFPQAGTFPSCWAIIFVSSIWVQNYTYSYYDVCAMFRRKTIASGLGSWITQLRRLGVTDFLPQEWDTCWMDRKSSAQEKNTVSATTPLIFVSLGVVIKRPATESSSTLFEVVCKEAVEVSVARHWTSIGENIFLACGYLNVELWRKHAAMLQQNGAFDVAFTPLCTSASQWLQSYLQKCEQQHSCWNLWQMRHRQMARRSFIRFLLVQFFRNFVTVQSWNSNLPRMNLCVHRESVSLYEDPQGPLHDTLWLIPRSILGNTPLWSTFFSSWCSIFSFSLVMCFIKSSLKSDNN